MCSMISSQCEELQRAADKVQLVIDGIGSGAVTAYSWNGVHSILRYATNVLRDAADTICELRDTAQQAQAERDEWHRVAKSKQDIIDHMRDARAENAKLREFVGQIWPIVEHPATWCRDCMYSDDCMDTTEDGTVRMGCAWREEMREIAKGLGIEVEGDGE